MTPIEKLEKLLAESTPGPWDFTWSEGEIEILDAGTGPDGRLYPGCEELYIYSSGESLICKEADLALIVELRNNAEALLAALRTQGERITKLEDALRETNAAANQLAELAGTFSVSGVYFDEPCFKENQDALKAVSDADDRVRTLLES